MATKKKKKNEQRSVVGNINCCQPIHMILQRYESCVKELGEIVFELTMRLFSAHSAGDFMMMDDDCPQLSQHHFSKKKKEKLLNFKRILSQSCPSFWLLFNFI